MNWRTCCFLMVLGLQMPLVAEAAPPRVVRLATLSWPPYNSTALAGGGVNTAVVRKAFALAGYRLELEVWPWTQAMRRGLTDPHLDGYFPEYLAPGVRRTCFLSERIGTSLLVLAKRKSQTYSVRGVQDLTRYRVGVVSGYNNTDAFDANVLNGRQRIMAAATDEENLQRLVQGRVDMVIIDRLVMQWLLRQPRLHALRDQIDSMEPPLQEQGLYICFKRDARGQQLTDSFSGGLHRMDAQSLMRDYLQQLGLP